MGKGFYPVYFGLYERLMEGEALSFPFYIRTMRKHEMNDVIDVFIEDIVWERQTITGSRDGTSRVLHRGTEPVGD